MGKKIILTNQHCDNRGDESATIGLINQLYNNFGSDSEIIMFKQTPDLQFIPSEYHITEQNMKYNFGFLLQCAVWIFFRFLHLDIRFLLSSQFKKFLKLHDDADLVISSCGGPYIGDLYINHEILHIFYILIPELLGKKVFFAAPSMGPFKKRIMNPLRRSILKRSKLIILRDKVSYDYVRAFLPAADKIHLAADACFADEILPKYPLDERQNVIGFTPLEYKYPASSDPDQDRENYKTSLIRLFDDLMDKDLSLKIEFFPQLYNKHSDLPLIHEFQDRMKYSDRTVIFSDQLSGPLQQREIGKTKMMIATRYHSAVFSCKMLVPCLCIAYEHKAFAMMNSFGLSDCVLDINHLTYEQLCEKFEYIRDRYENIYKKQADMLPSVTDDAKSTIRLIKEVYDREPGK